MAETTKLRARWSKDGRLNDYFGRHLRVIDIGCGDDPITPWCEPWDMPQGDATFMSGAERNAYDTVYSSHCLEHLWHPETALAAWCSLLKPNGHLVLYVPHRDLYERKQLLPSTWNADHKFFLLPDRDEAPYTWSLRALVSRSSPELDLVWITEADAGYSCKDGEHPVGEYSIEAVFRRVVPTTGGGTAG